MVCLVQAGHETEPLPQAGNALGLDVGLKSFIVDSDGNSVENPRFAENAAVKITGTQRRLSRDQKGHSYRRNLKDKLDKAHERINNQRSGFLHKLSRMYVNEYDIICVEDLDVIGLKENGNSKGTPRNIHDASWSKFMFMLSYKAQRAGRKLIAVDPRNTSQRRSCCDGIVKKEPSDRVHEYHYCGFSSDRDYNVAMNILLSGMEQPAEPIEPKSQHHASVVQVLFRKWEATPFRVR